MPHWCRIRLGNRFEIVGFPLVGLFRQLPPNRQRSGQRARVSYGSRGPLRRNRIMPSHSVKTNINATGIPQYGREWMAREDHV